LRIFIPEVEEKFGVAPDKVGDVLALMGDSVDNVPGIRGIGPKTATKLIQEHGGLEARWPPPRDEGQQAARKPDRAGRHGRLSRVLVALKEDCALPLPLEVFRAGRHPARAAGRLSGRHGFTSLLKRLDAGRGSPERATQLHPAKPYPAAPRGPAAPRCRRWIWPAMNACNRWRRWTAGSRAPLPPAWWRLTPKPARWMRSAPIWWG
jgi:DNA polymerase-1